MPLNNQNQSAPPWISPTLLNNWANVSGFASCQFRKFNNVVEIKGLIQAATGTMVTSGSIAFNLPAGYRPLETRNFAQFTNIQGTFVMGVLRVSPNGDCRLFFPAGTLSFIATEVVYIAEQ